MKTWAVETGDKTSSRVLCGVWRKQVIGKVQWWRVYCIAQKESIITGTWVDLCPGCCDKTNMITFSSHHHITKAKNIRDDPNMTHTSCTTHTYNVINPYNATPRKRPRWNPNTRYNKPTQALVPVTDQKKCTCRWRSTDARPETTWEKEL